MKDPLRYFLDEGFGNIYSFRNEYGRLEARIRWVKDYKDFIPSFGTKEGTTVITIDGVSYLTDDVFMAKYTDEVDSKDQAEQLINMDNAAWEMTKNNLSGVDL